jgi:hypothetical protein
LTNAVSIDGGTIYLHRDCVFLCFSQAGFEISFLIHPSLNQLFILQNRNPGKMLTSPLALLSVGLASATATKLYATHYSTKSVYTLSLDRASDGSYALTQASSLETCGTYPSWVTFDSATRTLYCSDEYGWKNENESVNGSLTALAAAADGLLSEIAVTGTAPGSGVHNVIYEGEDGQYLAVAH